MKTTFFLALLFGYTFCFGQDMDTLMPVELSPIMVTAYKEKPNEETSLNITSLKIDSLTQLGNYNLTDLMARTPGVQMLSTGVAITKPVIRGLYGNRILILLSGLRFDNQQWQEEHGLGLSDMGLSTVEIIKGPMSILHGTEAIGGIINVIEEDKPQPGTSAYDASVKFNSNTLGGMMQGGYKVNHGSSWWRIRGGIESNADYTDGNSDRVLNSRFKGVGLKATYGFQKKNWISTNNFLSTFNKFGFIFNDVYEFVKPDERWSRSLADNPAHMVFLNILSSENKIIYEDDSKLNINVGIQSNERLENEGGGAISLNMHLLTLQYLAKWEKQITRQTRLILSNLGAFEDNTNYGSRKIVPDAIMQESNISGYIETTVKHQLVIENGIGIGEKYIKTYFTPTVNGPEKEVHPFDKFSPYYNFYTGLTYFPSREINIKLNAATGVRIPNLAELSSNGLHEGIFTYEIGDPHLSNEQSLSLNLAGNYSQPLFDVSITPFYNYIFNYVYLAPTDEEWFGFPVYRYKQQDATQYGTEISLTLRPVAHVQAEISYAGMISKTADGNYTPYNPAQKMTPSLQYNTETPVFKNIHLFTTFDYFFAQDHIAPFEIATPAYGLWNLGASATLQGNRQDHEISIVINNLLNEAYYDHLSRFKYFGLLNMGRNIVVNYKIIFGRPVKEK